MFTVTIAVQVELLPFTSVTVRVTVLLAPTLEVVNEFGMTELDAIPHASLAEAVTSAGTIEAVPEVESVIENGLQTMTGWTLSWTVTVALAVEELPLTSVTVRSTVFGPTLAQVNAFGRTVIDAMPQLSELPLLTCDAVTDA